MGNVTDRKIYRFSESNILLVGGNDLLVGRNDISYIFHGLDQLLCGLR